jgi:hypothetical protein
MSTHSYLQAVLSLLLGKSTIGLWVNIWFVNILAGLFCKSEVVKLHLRSCKELNLVNIHSLLTCPHGIVAPSADLSLSKLASMAITSTVRGQLRIG